MGGPGRGASASRNPATTRRVRNPATHAATGGPDAMPDPTPSKAADARQQEEVIETFPASDPLASAAGTGARAVPPAAMQGSPPEPLPGAVTLRRDFADAEAAKLALEGLVRDGPVDRRAAEIGGEAAGTLRLRVPPADAERIEALLARA